MSLPARATKGLKLRETDVGRFRAQKKAELEELSSRTEEERSRIERERKEKAKEMVEKEREYKKSLEEIKEKALPKITDEIDKVLPDTIEKAKLTIEGCERVLAGNDVISAVLQTFTTEKEGNICKQMEDHLKRVEEAKRELEESEAFLRNLKGEEVQKKEEEPGISGIQLKKKKKRGEKGKAK